MLNVETRRPAPATPRARTSRPIRVLRIIDRLNVGGPAKHVVWLTAGLDRAAFETRLVTGAVPAGESDMQYFAAGAGVEPVVVRQMSRELGPRDIVAFVRVLRLLWQVRPDVVHTHKAKAGAVGRAAAWLYRWATPSALRLRPRPCRVVHTYHGHMFHSYYGPVSTAIFLAIERLLARVSDRIVVISPQQREEIVERFRVGRVEQFDVIPLGIDFDEVADAPGRLRGSLGLAPDDFVVGITGRLTEIKNHALLLDVAARVRAMQTAPRPIRFVFVGDGHLREPLERRVAELGLGDSVVFAGFRADAAALYGDVDVAALTSRNEGTPLSLIEAMGCGRPVAATEVGGVVDLLGQRRERRGAFSVWDHGVTARSDDADGFAEALRFLIERPELRNTMGERARVFARQTFDKARLVRDVQALYTALMEGPRAARR